MRSLYVITVIAETKPDTRAREVYGKYDQRCVSVCTSLENAKNIIESNVLDIHEMYYRYAVIEEQLSDSVYDSRFNFWWYEWDASLESYVYMETGPDDFRHTVCIGLG